MKFTCLYIEVIKVISLPKKTSYLGHITHSGSVQKKRKIQTRSVKAFSPIVRTEKSLFSEKFVFFIYSSCISTNRSSLSLIA